MFIRLFIKTTDNKKSIMIANEIICCINEDNIKYQNIKTQHYWKFDNITLAEIQLL
jgi:hypothetical protein